MEIGFNNRYLLDALRYSKCEKLRLEINGPLSPVKVLPVEGEDFIYLVLPVRFKNEADTMEKYESTRNLSNWMLC